MNTVYAKIEYTIINGNNNNCSLKVVSTIDNNSLCKYIHNVAAESTLKRAIKAIVSSDSDPEQIESIIANMSYDIRLV